MARIQQASWRRWLHRAAVCAVALACCTNLRVSAQASSPDFVRDGRSTYCWGLNADPLATTITRESAFMSATGAACPLAISLASKPASVPVNEAPHVSWIVSTSNASAFALMANATSGGASTPRPSANSSSSSMKPFVVVHSAIHVCGSGAEAPCDPFSAAFQRTNASANQFMNLASFAPRDSITFSSDGEVALAAPGEYTIAAYVVVSGASRLQRFDFVVFATVSVSARVRASADDSLVGGTGGSGDGGGSGLPLGVSPGQLIMICALLVCILGCAAVVLVLAVRRRRRERAGGPTEVEARAKVSNTAALSPETGESQRFSDWSEIYATQDGLPSSILVDDRNTVAILRASRVSSPAHSAQPERKVADFTRDVGYWDVRPSASPITPLASFFFPPSAGSSLHEDDDGTGSGDLEDDRAPASPTDSFVPLESLGRRRTRPRHPEALDDLGLTADEADRARRHPRNSDAVNTAGGGDDDEDEEEEREVEF